jgi:flagellar biosynthetic protein FliR
VSGLALEPAALGALGSFALLCARLLPVALLAPWAGVGRAPLSLPPAITLVLALCLWPAVAAQPGALAAPPSAFAFAALGLRELLIGAVYGIALALPLRAFEWAGELTAHFAGTADQRESSPYARLQLLVAVAAFFALGGHRVAISALADSLAHRPLGVLSAATGAAAVALGSVRLVADAFALALLLALPVAAAVAFSQIALALSARAALTSAAAALAAPLRAGVVLLVVWTSGLFWLELLPSEIERALAAAVRLLAAP